MEAPDPSGSGNPAMLSGARVIAFAATAQPERARAFYGGTLGLPLVEENAFALVFDANGVGLRVQKVETASPPPYTSLGWAVGSIRDTVRALSEEGVAVERYPFLQQDEQGIWHSPSGARVAWFRDPDGNLLSVVEHMATGA